MGRHSATGATHRTETIGGVLDYLAFTDETEAYTQVSRTLEMRRQRGHLPGGGTGDSRRR
jgi:hypothetical protein